MRIAVMFAIVALLALAACVDRGQCLASHREKYEWLLPIQFGSISVGNGVSIPQYIYVPQTSERTVCDRWEFPEGKP